MKQMSKVQFFLCLTEMNADGPMQAAVRDIVHRARKFQHLLGSEHCSICDKDILFFTSDSCSQLTGKGECEGL
jgi:hypothetical protein